jgi:hypothetical protein
METKHCNGCNQDKPLSEYNFTRTGKRAGKPLSRCRDCNNAAYKTWWKAHEEYKRAYNNNWKHAAGYHRAVVTAKDCTAWLGVHIAEHALSNFFEDITRMPTGNPGYDFICKNGFKIDVKSSCIRTPVHHSPRWTFTIDKNQLADYFLLLAFDSRESLTPMHVWLVPGKAINQNVTLTITNLLFTMDKWNKYEHPLDKVINQCSAMRGTL